MRRLLLACLLLLAVTAPAARADVTGPEIVGFLNAQRSAHGIPAGIVEDPAYSDGCVKHNHYMALNGITHFEEEGKPGYTQEGADAGATSVLYQGDHWTATNNPFETAPIHLHQLLAPRLDRSGAFESEGFGCASTQASQTRPAPPADVAYTYPRDGATDWRPSETATESPYTPGERVGIPAGATTGPYLYVMFDGPDLMPGQPASGATATLTGPDGAVDVAVVDNTTSGLEGYLPTGMEVIPRRPLAPGRTYLASVSATVAGRPFSHSWSFTTGALENAIEISSIRADTARHISAQVASSAPGGTLTLTGPAATVTVPIDAAGRAEATVGAAGQWTACARSGGGTTGYKPAEACGPVNVPALPAGSPKPGKAYAVSLRRKSPRSRQVLTIITTNKTVRFEGRILAGRRRQIDALRRTTLTAGKQWTYSTTVPRGIKRVRLRARVTYKGRTKTLVRKLRL